MQAYMPTGADEIFDDKPTKRAGKRIFVLYHRGCDDWMGTPEASFEFMGDLMELSIPQSKPRRGRILLFKSANSRQTTTRSQLKLELKFWDKSFQKVLLPGNGGARNSKPFSDGMKMNAISHLSFIPSLSRQRCSEEEYMASDSGTDCYKPKQRRWT